MIIFITEKPSVAQEYKKVLKVSPTEKTDGYIEGYSPVLNKNVQITWAVGHLIALATVPEQKEGRIFTKAELEQNKSYWKKEDLPILPDNWVYKENAATYKQYLVVKKLYTSKDVECIYYAGDSGREGIYIQALIRNQIFGGRNPSCDEKVVWIDSQTEEEILRGIREAKPYSAYKDMIDSGYARAIDDWLMGMNFTQGYTLSCGGMVNVGRVMTPTLAMVVDKQKEIDEFKAVDYFGIKAETETIVPKWIVTEKSKYYETPYLYNDTGFKDKSVAESLINEFNNDKKLTVVKSDKKEKKEYAPLLFNLADLQAYCSKKLHISPDQTLQIAQSLYEKKLITYPRTDARVLSSAVAKELSAKFGKEIPTKYVDDSKITDHYAIIPTFKPIGDDLSSVEKYVYASVLNRFKAIFMPPYVYDSIKIVFLHSNGETFTCDIKNVKDLGYKKLYTEETENEDLRQINPPLVGDVISVNEFTLNEMQTKPPTAYTTGTLILAMEKAGKLIEDEELREQIKTCGTRANIIQKLQDRGYIFVDKKQKVTPSEIGKEIIAIIRQVDSSLTSPEKTAELEQKLSDIANGTLRREDHEKNMKGYITKQIELIKNLSGMRISTAKSKGNSNNNSVDVKCPFCSSEIKYGKFGWYCPNKDFSMGLEICGHKTKAKDVTDIVNKGSTSKYKFTSKAGKKFEAKLVLNKENKKIEFSFD